jgi:cytoskeletal protein RodZ
MISSSNTSAIAAFCKELRDAREFQLISLQEVAQMSRISIEFLDALERGHWDRIPRAYVRGYLGLYAQTVGMNRDKVLRTFDHLMLPGAAAGAAVLDDAPPLLNEPTDVGVTRAKIRTSWFAALSRNRKVFYPLTFVALLLLVGLLNFTRRSQANTTPLIPFSEAILEAQQNVHSPLTDIPLSDSILSTTLRNSAIKRVLMIGSGPGILQFSRDSDPRRVFRFNAYDTIKIQYLTEMSARIWPSNSMDIFEDSTRIRPETVQKGDTAIFDFQASRPVKVDSMQIMSDSL